MTEIVRLIPTAEDLREKVNQIISLYDREARDAWLNHKCTRALVLLLEASRMESIERMENGATGDVLHQCMAQSQLASSLVDDIQLYFVEPLEEEVTDDDSD